jgi:prepilin-type N-terminal cleavage/methylation domain-containing protein
VKTKTMRNATRGSKADGFSLLEVLIATAVLAFGILGMAQLFLLAIGQNRRAGQNTETSNMLAYRMEQLREFDYCILKAAASTAWATDAPLRGENMGQNAAWGGVMAGHSDRGFNIDTRGDGGADWVVERRLLTSCAGSGAITEIDKQAVDDVVLIELRGYRRGVRSEKGINWVYMSSYRTPRVPGACPCP